MRRCGNRHGGAADAKTLLGRVVHLLVGDIQRNAGNVGGGFVDFDPVELPDIDADAGGNFEQFRAVLAPDGGDDFVLQFAQFPVGHHEEIATPAGRIENPDRGQLVVEGGQAFLAIALVPGGFELGAQAIHEQRVDGAQDVPLAGEVRAQLAPAGFALVVGVGVGVFQHALKHRAENGRGNLAPVDVVATGEQRFPHRAIEDGQAGIGFV